MYDLRPSSCSPQYYASVLILLTVVTTGTMVGCDTMSAVAVAFPGIYPH